MLNAQFSIKGKISMYNDFFTLTDQENPKNQ